MLLSLQKVLAYRFPPLSLSLKFRIPSLGGGMSVRWGGERVFSGTVVLLLVFVNKTLHGNGK